jgi:hypothetical protein
MTAKAFANRLASVQERAVEALPSLPANPWRRRRSAVPGAAAAFSLGILVGLGVALVLYLAPHELKTGVGEAEAEPRADLNPIQ